MNNKELDIIFDAEIFGGNQEKGYIQLRKNKRIQSNKRERKSAVRLMK